ncbi:uncharacterized protein BDZ99DRAFT_481423 [Mytilinidion resinicola]|uniref:Uncharacterized protein n=1 Tax=Mytilinidion resinicola TaxID=574789 RepID=A0A6A6Y5Z4_9PEZI|nr:uncharacterized protein BDZ99DRAFT_481423 [Mytilinidion resinicola]KAF2804271.1 hypothetical protein BDZ99DRAFT_481423 [Mytilinidion resinicola]
MVAWDHYGELRARAKLAPRRQTLGELARSMSVANTIPLPPSDDSDLVDIPPARVVPPPAPITSAVAVPPAVRTPVISWEESALVTAPARSAASSPPPRRRERAGTWRRVRGWFARVFGGKKRGE